MYQNENARAERLFLLIEPIVLWRCRCRRRRRCLSFLVTVISSSNLKANLHLAIIGLIWPNLTKKISERTKSDPIYKNLWQFYILFQTCRFSPRAF